VLSSSPPRRWPSRSRPVRRPRGTRSPARSCATCSSSPARSSIPRSRTTSCATTSRRPGSDGYQVLVAWGEIDPDFANQDILLAVMQDGASLADQGPRLVVPSDGRGGRYVSGVARIRLDRGR